MLRFISLMVNAWNIAWWDHHCQLARMHDARLGRRDPEWRERLG